MQKITRLDSYCIIPSMPEIETNIIKIPLSNRLFRAVVSATYGRLIPYELYDTTLGGENGLTLARTSLEEGNGLIIAHTHSNKGDSPRVALMVFDDEVMRERELAVPIALHQVKPWQSIFGQLIHAPNIPVITPQTQVLLRETGLPEINGHEARKMTLEYLNQTVEILSHGGVALIAPQGTRQPQLKDVTSAVSTLVKAYRRYGVENLAILFVGTEIPEQSKKPDPDSINHGLLYHLNIGNCFSLKKLLQEAKQEALRHTSQEEKSRTHPIDRVVLRKLQPLVGYDYLPRFQPVL